MRRRFVIVIVACIALVAAACDLHKVVPPGPAGATRYRDEIFANVTKSADISYGSAVNQQGQTVNLLLDVYRPTGDAVAAGRPAVIWIHGGSFRSGNKTSPEIVDEANTFARKGYVSVSISYRLSTNGCTIINLECVTAIQQATEDAQNAVRFVKNNAAAYGIDANRIAVAGTSAGAITAVNVGFTPQTAGTPATSSSVRASVSLSGARIVSTANPGDAPVLLFHGTADSLVPYQWAVDTLNEAKASGITAYLTTWNGAGHVPYVQNRTEIISQTTNFLYFMMNLNTAPK
jgi:acetyl esterase/lipase